MRLADHAEPHRKAISPFCLQNVSSHSTVIGKRFPMEHQRAAHIRTTIVRATLGTRTFEEEDKDVHH